MKLLDEYEMSEWAYGQCVIGNYSEEIESLIKDGYWKHFHLRHWLLNKKCNEKIRKELNENNR